MQIVILSSQAQETRAKTKVSKDVKASEPRSWAYACLGTKVGQGRPLVAKATQQPSVLGSALDSEGSRAKPKGNPRHRKIATRQSDPRTYTHILLLFQKLSQPQSPGSGTLG